MRGDWRHLDIEHALRTEWQEVCRTVRPKADPWYDHIAIRAWDDFWQPVLELKIKALRRPFDQEKEEDMTCTDDNPCVACAVKSSFGTGADEPAPTGTGYPPAQELAEQVEVLLETVTFCDDVVAAFRAQNGQLLQQAESQDDLVTAQAQEIWRLSDLNDTEHMCMAESRDSFQREIEGLRGDARVAEEHYERVSMQYEAQGREIATLRDQVATLRLSNRQLQTKLDEYENHQVPRLKQQIENQLDTITEMRKLDEGRRQIIFDLDKKLSEHTL